MSGSAWGISPAGVNDWRHEAACLEEDSELFFPIGNTGPAIEQIEEAKAVCRRCEVRETCLDWALDRGEDAGIWGGLSEDERRSLKRRTARQARTPGPSAGGPRKPKTVPVDYVPAVHTTAVVTALRAARKTWAQVAQILECNDSTAQRVARGERVRVARRTEENAQRIAGQWVGA